MLNLGLYKIFSFDTKKLSFKLFKQRLSLTYVFFNTLYKKIIINNVTDDSQITKFHNSGFSKLDINFADEINEFKDKFFLKEDEKKGNKKKVAISLNDVDKKIFSSKIKKKIRPLIDKLENYFNCDVILSQIILARNFHHEDKHNLNISHYSNHFHQDNYLINYNKVFVNLMDINENDGPLEIVPRENKSSFIKSFNYNDMYNHNTDGDNNLVYKNTGKTGDSLLFSSTQIFHRAGVPQNFRDYMTLILVTIPKNKSEGLSDIDQVEIFNDNSDIIYRVSKPYSAMKVFKLFFLYFRNKWKN